MALLVLKCLLLPVAIKVTAAFIPGLWARAIAWFALGAAFAAAPPRITSGRQIAVGAGVCAAVTALLLFVVP